MYHAHAFAHHMQPIWSHVGISRLHTSFKKHDACIGVPVSRVDGHALYGMVPVPYSLVVAAVVLVVVVVVVVVAVVVVVVEVVVEVVAEVVVEVVEVEVDVEVDVEVEVEEVVVLCQ